LDEKKFAEGYSKAFGSKVPWYEREDRYQGEEPEVESGGTQTEVGPPPAPSQPNLPGLEGVE